MMRGFVSRGLAGLLRVLVVVVYLAFFVSVLAKLPACWSVAALLRELAQQLSFAPWARGTIHARMHACVLFCCFCHFTMMVEV